MKFCTNCGARLNPGAVFCPHCGTKVAQAVSKPFEITQQFWWGFYLTLAGAAALVISLSIDHFLDTAFIPQSLDEVLSVIVIALVCIMVPGILLLAGAIVRGFNHRRTGLGYIMVSASFLLTALTTVSLMEVSINDTLPAVMAGGEYLIAIIAAIGAYFVSIFVTGIAASATQQRKRRLVMAAVTIIPLLLAMLTVAGTPFSILALMIMVVAIVGMPFFGQRFSLPGGREWQLLSRERHIRRSWRFYLSLLIFLVSVGLLLARVYQAEITIGLTAIAMVGEWWSNPGRLNRQQRELAGSLLVGMDILLVVYLLVSARLFNLWPILMGLLILQGAGTFTYLYTIIRTRFVITGKAVAEK